MANPFSGLENIGASYMAGARLAQERQRRADEIAARQEEARIRQQYYQDIIAEREAARLEGAKSRRERAAAQFGEDVKLTPEGDIDYQASAAAAQARKRTETLNRALGTRAGMGVGGGVISPEVQSTTAYQEGMLQGELEKMKEQRTLQNILLNRGFMELPSDGTAVPPFGFDGSILDGRSTTPTADETQTFEIGGRKFAKMPGKPAKTPSAGQITYETPEGEVRENLTPERLAELRKMKGAMKAGGGTNQPPVGRIVFDQNAPGGVRYIPNK